MKLTIAIALLSATCLLLTTSCSEEPSTPNPNETPQGPVLTSFDEACDHYEACRQDKYSAQNKVPIWRVEIIRDAQGEISIGATDRVEVPEQTGRPTSPVYGTHMLLAYDAQDEAKEMYMVQFPDQLVGGSTGIFHTHITKPLTNEEVRTIAYVAATDVTKLVVVDDQGQTITERAIADLEGGLDVKQQALWQPSSSCPHVIVLDDKADYAWIPTSLLATIVPPSDLQKALIRTALNNMEPLMCHAIKRIVLFKDSKIVTGGTAGAVAAYTAADMIMLNAELYNDSALQKDAHLRMSMIGTLFHEATHSVQNILEVKGNGTTASNIMGGWNSTANQQAWRTIDELRLKKGLNKEWRRMHESFISLGWAQPYTGWSDSDATNAAIKAKLIGLNEDEIARAGGMSRYGRTKGSEDMAEMTAATKLRWLYKKQGVPRIRTTKDGRRILEPEDSACVALQDLGPSLPANYSAVFTKLNMLRQMGLITDEEYKECQGPGIDIKRDQQGMFFQQGEGNINHFAGNVTATIGTDEQGTYKFVFTSQGQLDFGDTTSKADATLTLTVGEAGIPLEEASWPRGIYSLAPAQGNDFRVFLPDAEAGSFEVFDGDVLIFESSSQSISGSIVIRRAMRWLAPVPVPQTFDPPLSVRFYISK